MPTLFITFFETERVATIHELTEETSLGACQKEMYRAKKMLKSHFLGL